MIDEPKQDLTREQARVRSMATIAQVGQVIRGRNRDGAEQAAATAAEGGKISTPSATGEKRRVDLPLMRPIAQHRELVQARHSRMLSTAH